MGAPPTTPAPSRFLLSKRPHTQQSQAQTPNQQDSAGPQRFHPTPRFSISTQKRATTPALAIKTKTPRLRTTQDLIDDSSPLSEEGNAEVSSLLPETNLPEPIEFDSSFVPQSSLPITGEQKHEDYDEDYEDFDPRPLPKRRRISIVSLSSSPSLDPQGFIPITSRQLSNSGRDYDEIEIDDASDDDEKHDLITSLGSSPPRPLHSLVALPSSLSSSSSSTTTTIKPKDRGEVDLESSPIKDLTPRQTNIIKREPIFHPPPKFKSLPAPNSPLGIKAELPPDTPHRYSKKQRDKYLAGGLASEVRDWLVDAKELFFNPPPDSTTTSDGGQLLPTSVQLKLTKVQHAAGGAGMIVVRARQEGQEGGEVNVILAGEGMAAQGGLDKDKRSRGLPKAGATVSIGLPAWDVDLGQEGLGTWAVAYRWEALEDEKE